MERIDDRELCKLSWEGELCHAYLSKGDKETIEIAFIDGPLKSVTLIAKHRRDDGEA